MRLLRAFLILCLLLAGLLVALWRGWLDVPPRWNPWAVLDIRETPNLLAGFKLWRLEGDLALCQQALSTSPLRYTLQVDSSPTAACPLSNTLRVQASDVRFSSSFMASCPLAAAFALFERHGLQPAAQAVFGQPVVQVEHVGSFACRTIAGTQRRSQHASANALDIVGFRLADGRRISVLQDWPKQVRTRSFCARCSRPRAGASTPLWDRNTTRPIVTTFTWIWGCGGCAVKNLVRICCASALRR